LFNGGTLQITQNVTGTRAITMTGAGTFAVFHRLANRHIERSRASHRNGTSAGDILRDLQRAAVEKEAARRCPEITVRRNRDDACAEGKSAGKSIHSAE